MASILRQIVAGPRIRNPEAGLDLCYVTDNIIATSGPSSTYPQRAYRNPTDALVKFLDSKHKEHWAIWEFRAEGTGYPDSEVHGRIKHYPWPDHHPPPFALIPNIMASMRNWLMDPEAIKHGRVVVVHCKAGKGRSGTVACSYLISEEGWTVEDALARFTERRMRVGFGAGVSIPSQLRWVGYVGRWTKHGKLYVERKVEIAEVHVWGLREGVKVAVEGFVEEGRKIKTFHTFNKHEKIVVDKTSQRNANLSPTSDENSIDSPISNKDGTETPISSMSSPSVSSPNSASTNPVVLFRPSKPLILPTNDVNIDLERRNHAPYGMSLVTSVAHVWFNAYFEGLGPENSGHALTSGVFEIEWDAMDGLKGSKSKGTRAFDRIAVVWKVPDEEETQGGIVIREPELGEPVPETQAADWKGEGEKEKDLGMRLQSPQRHDGDISEASSVHSMGIEARIKKEKETKPPDVDDEQADDSSLEGVQIHLPDGDNIDGDKPITAPAKEAANLAPKLTTNSLSIDTKTQDQSAPSLRVDTAPETLDSQQDTVSETSKTRARDDSQSATAEQMRKIGLQKVAGIMQAMKDTRMEEKDNSNTGASH
ncbi:Telomerase protein component 1 [Agyrium rufum]|nr:Telomerase protein component 1 [Agyrium rufum]